MLIFHNCLTISIDQTKRQTAELRTLATIGTPAKTGLTNITLTTITDTQSAMYKDFKRRVRAGFVYFTYLPQRKFTGKYYLMESRIGKKLNFIRRPVIHLCTGMQRDRRQV